VADLVKAQVSHCKEMGWKFLFTENGEPLYLDNDIYKELGLNLPSDLSQLKMRVSPIVIF
jgi:hypothetical protein